MKKYILRAYKLILPVFLLTGLLITSCTIDKNMNNSPNAVNENAVKSKDGVFGLLIGLQADVADFYSGDRSRIASIWTWQMAATDLGRPQPVSWNQYKMEPDGPPDQMWILGYRGIKISQDIIDFTPQINNFADNNTAAQQVILGIAKTYRAIIFGELAAFYGSIVTNVNGLNPSPFVTQTDAYATVQQLLDQALGHFQAASDTTFSLDRDLNFTGDARRWIPVVHSLKARYFLHLNNFASALSEANLGITSAADNLFGIYTNTLGEYSPWGHWTNTEAGSPIRAEMTYVRLLKAEANDNRLAAYFTPADPKIGIFGYAAHAEANADTNETVADKAATLNKYGGYGDKFPLISYEETVLIRAEAEARTGNVGGAVTDVNIIRTAAGLTNYSGSNADSVVAQVLLQKNLQLFLEGQNYTDMRRTGTLPEAVKWDGARGNLRFFYGVSEKNANPNVPADNDNLVGAILNAKYK